MPEQLTTAEQQLRDTCQSFANDVLLAADTSDPIAARTQVREASQAMGLFSLTQPTEFGGRDSVNRQLSLCIARETLAAANPPLLDAVFGSSPGVLGGVEEPLRSSHLVPLINGDKRASFGFTEPDNVQPTSGRLTAEGLVINGQKSYVTGGADADFISALVHIEDRGPSMVVIDTHLQGVDLAQRFNSLDGSHHAAFTFSNVLVPETHIIGDAGKGLPRALRQIGDVRLLVAAQASGYMLWVLNLLKEHLAARDKNGEPRGSKDVVRWHYADLRVQAYAARSMLYRTARLADSGANAVNESMATKIFVTEAVGNAVDIAIQLVGGQALVEDHPLAQLYQKVRAWRLVEGANDVLRLNIGRGILELDKGRI